MDVDFTRERVRHYVERGIFTGFAEQPSRRGKVSFRFRWLLNTEFELRIDPEKNEYCCPGILPGVAARSHLDREIRKFLAQRSAADLPEHRRVDPDKASLSFRVRRDQGSIHMQVAEGEQAYATKALFTLLNDLFAWLNLYHINYLHREFGVPEE